MDNFLFKFLKLIIFLQIFNYPVTFSQTAEDEAVEAILNQEPICTGNKVVQCGRSCGEYYICFGTHVVRNQTCEQDRPFCRIGPNGDYCDTQRDLSRFMCQPLSFLFQCTDVGYFPDPTDCTAYYICTPFGGGTHYNPVRHACGENSIYNARLRRCQPFSQNTPCHTVSCTEGSSAFLPFPGNNQYFYNCVERSVWVPSGKIPVVYRCLSTTTGNPATFVNGTCTTPCPQAGRFEVPDTSKSFIQCDSQRQATLHECPGRLEYISSTARCQ